MGTLNGDTFIDILEDRRKTSDISWSIKPWDVASCRYSRNRDCKEIKDEILNSAKIQTVIRELSKEKGCDVGQTHQRAKDILEEMAHTFDMKAIRFFGYTLSKFMKRVYGSILVNKKGVEKIGSIATQYPILFLPTHRSYADFLLVSYICFYFDVPVPVIAAGLDFLGLKKLSSLLRAAGAFFIRRSFIGDRLYKEIFSEYVQTHIEGTEFPMEFFIEGTRSRTAKSLVPKLGMLQVILETFFSSKVPDIMVVPISISYDRTLEETLYAYELLGVPKPKESTTGLIKARKVLSDYFGNVYVRFCEPISLKEYFWNYDRSIHNLHPRSMSVVSKEDYQHAKDLANHIVRMHQCNLLLSPFPIVCLVIGQPKVQKSGGIHFNHLLDNVIWLEELVRRTGATVYVGTTLAETITYHLRLHPNIVKVSDESVISLINIEAQNASSSHVPRLCNDTVKYAIPSMLVYHYGNQALQLLVHVSMISMALWDINSEFPSQDVVFSRYQVLRKLLQREFVFERTTVEKDFYHALQSLKDENMLNVDETRIVPVQVAYGKLEMLRSFLSSFLESYHVICRYLSHKDEVQSCCKAFSHECQAEIERSIRNGHISDYRCLSLDIVSNCIALLLSLGALHKVERSGETVMIPSQSEISDVLLNIEMFLPNFGYPHPTTGISIPSAKL